MLYFFYTFFRFFFFSLRVMWFRAPFGRSARGLLCEGRGGEGGGHLSSPLTPTRGTWRQPLWWAIQVTKALELGKDRPRCWVYCYYLEQQPEDDAGNSRWRLLSGNELHVFYEELVIDPVTGRPFSVASHDLPMGWDTTRNVVFSLPTDLCDRLDRAASRRLDPAAAEDERDGASADEGGSGDDDEQPGGSSEGDGSSAVHSAREQRRIDRAAARAGRARGGAACAP